MFVIPSVVSKATEFVRVIDGAFARGSIENAREAMDEMRSRGAATIHAESGTSSDEVHVAPLTSTAG